jgi:enoyl-CoA hydratase
MAMTVLLARVEEFGLLTLNRPDALNALNADVLSQIDVAIDDVGASDARALIITGAGDKAFCAGADIKEIRVLDLMAKKRNTEIGQAVLAKLGRLRIASVALVNGYAFGGGLELALACTFRLATPHAAMALPEIKLGLIPGYGGTQRLPRVVGEARALEMIMTGRTVRAQEAFGMGLVNRIVEGDPLVAAIDFAREFSGYSLPCLHFARDAVQRGLSVSLDEGLAVEADVSTLAYQCDDAKEGVSAFVEKRKPLFKDR